ncbi:MULTISPECIES: endonuclease/exonuclease/phosphatase family protein [unclassified Nocardioides]|uniref:endonuclease/exonuclease/phosphatase family protein n=1 Tax=unclassified Nocardioides TaxID=2615069 RepID=UPI0030145729
MDRPPAYRLLILTTALLGALLAPTPSATAAADRRDEYERTTIEPTRAVRRGTGAQQSDGDARHGTLGVVSFNVYRKLSDRELRADLRRLTANRHVDVIGFQESDGLRGVLRGLPRGWRFWMSDRRTNSREVAIAWRTRHLDLRRARVAHMHPGIDGVTRRPGRWDYRFPARYTTRALFREKRSGAELRVLNTHVNHRTEAYYSGRPGVPYRNHNTRQARKHLRTLRAMVQDSAARYTVVTGDLNFDHVADRIKKPRGFVHDVLTPVAVSSFSSLGIRGVPPTNPESGRYIDYVMLKRGGPATFVRQKALGGYRSDHRPLLAVVALD